MMKKSLLRVLLLGILFQTVLPVLADDAAMAKLKRFFGNIAAYHTQYTQEKVYLHLDNNGYFPGECIWFKAYVVGAGSLLPTDLSKVLYVELLTPEGEVLQRKTYPIMNGRTNGEFNLNDVIHTGYYEVRAYTRAMLNWDPACVYSRVIPIFDNPKDSLNFGELSMYVPNNEIDKAVRRPIATPYKDENTQYEGKTLLTFYPEGGYITQGLPSRVAFKVTDKGGEPLNTTVRLFNMDKTEVTSSSTVHEGMGVLQVPSDWNGGYAEVTNANGKQVEFKLPTPRPVGCDVSTMVDGNGDLVITARSNAGFSPQTIGVSVTCRGVACYFDTLQISSSAVCTKKVPRKQLRDGIQQVTLFSTEGEILSERLTWIAPHKEPMMFTVAQNAASFQPFSPVVLDFKLADAQGNPQQGEFSLAVHDVDGELGLEGSSINTELLLCSDLKGYIHNPEYYLENNDEAHLKALELLMMVQGWRRYSWKEMSGVEPFVLKQPVEDGLLVDGRIVDNTNKHNGKEGYDVNLMIMQGGKFVSGSTKSDANGNFALLAPKFYGDGIGYFTTTVNDKRKSCNVALNRGFSPDPSAYEPQALKWEVEKFKDNMVKLEPELFQWTDTLPRIIHLGEIDVRAKMRLHTFGSRYTWAGGEEAGKRVATLYYNVEDALERLLDKGEREPGLWDWLASVNPNLVIETPTISSSSSFSSDGSVNLDNHQIDKLGENNNPILTYRGLPVRVLLDNDNPIRYSRSAGGEGDINYMMSDIRSILISEGSDTYRRFTGENTNVHQSVTIMLYSRVDKSLAQYKKGQRITVLHGYSKYEEFFSPQYRTMDSPTPSDVRRTLYWNPNVITDKNGKANVIFFSNSRKEQHIRVNAQGIAVTGQMFSNK